MDEKSDILLEILRCTDRDSVFKCLFVSLLHRTNHTFNDRGFFFCGWFSDVWRHAADRALRNLFPHSQLPLTARTTHVAHASENIERLGPRGPLSDFLFLLFKYAICGSFSSISYLLGVYDFLPHFVARTSRENTKSSCRQQIVRNQHQGPVNKCLLVAQ